MKIWIDGGIVGEGEARVPVTDHGLLYGDGVFEGIRVYGGRVFRLDDHLARLEARVAAEELLTRQNRVTVEVTEKEGKRKVPGVFWDTGTTHRPADVLDTCFALLFLKRATRDMVPTAAVTGG